MSVMSYCAKCGKISELCESVRIDGIKQPRFCKDCLIVIMRTGDESFSEINWLLQLSHLNDVESLSSLRKIEILSRLKKGKEINEKEN